MDFNTICQFLQDNLIESGFEIYPFLVNHFAPINDHLLKKNSYFRYHGIILSLTSHSVYRHMMMIQLLFSLLVHQVCLKKRFYRMRWTKPKI